VSVHEGRGQIEGLVDLGDGRAAGMFSWTASLLLIDLATLQCVAQQNELRFGDFCQDALSLGPDGWLWGLATQGIFRVPADLSAPAELAATYPPHRDGGLYRFGAVWDEQGRLYFPNGPHLLRMSSVSAGASAPG